MKIKWIPGESNVLAFIYPRDIDRTAWITVERKKVFCKEDFEDATINWSAIGSTDVETADLFAQGMKKAVGIAKTLNQTLNHYKITIKYTSDTYETIRLAPSKYQILEWLECELKDSKDYIEHEILCLDENKEKASVA